MSELQLVNKYEPDCNFVIDDILEEDKEISLDDTHPGTVNADGDGIKTWDLKSSMQDFIKFGKEL